MKPPDQTPPDDVIRLWPEGPPSRLEGVGPEVTYREPVRAAGDAAVLRNVSEPTLSVFRPARPNGTPSDRWIDLFHDWLGDQGFG